MSILRKIGLFFAASLLSLFLFVLAISTNFKSLAGSADQAKSLVKDTGLYDNLIDGVLSKLEEAPAESADEISVSNPIVSQAVKDTITPQFLQQSTENAIDGIFNWLNGKTAEPDFKIDLAPVIDTLANKVGEGVKQRVASLPVCPRSTPATEFDGLSASCRPSSVSPDEAANQIRSQINSGELLKDPLLTAEDLKNKDTGQSVFSSTLDQAPGAYQKINSSPVFLVVLSLLLALAVVFLSASRLKGLRRVGTILVSTGAILLVGAFILNTVASKIEPKSGEQIKLEDSAKKIGAEVARKLGGSNTVFGAAYAGSGVLLIGGSMYLGRRNHSKQAHHETEHDKAESPEKPEPTESSAESPKNKTKES